MARVLDFKPFDERSSMEHVRSSQGAGRRGGAWRPLLVALGFAALVLLPFLAGTRGVPDGATFFGSLKALGDEGVYMAAVYQGGHGQWLWHDPYMVHPPPPVLMYPTYMLFGHVGALLRLSVATTYDLMHALAGMLLVATLWRLAKHVPHASARGWIVAFGIGMSGLYWLDALLGAGGSAPASLPWMGLPPLSGLTSALMGAHETLGTSGQLMVLAGLLDTLDANGSRRLWGILYAAAGTALIGLTLPMLLPVTVATTGLYTLWRVRGARVAGESTGMLAGTLAAVGAMLLPGLLVAGYYYWQLSYGGWAASSLRYTATRPIVESILQWGATLPLGFWGWRAAGAAVRPLANLLALWCAVAVVGIYLPFWQGFRFSTGLTTMVGVLFALGLLEVTTTQRVRMRWLLVVSLGGLMQLLALFSILLPGRASALYVGSGPVSAMRWLGAHTTSHDVVLAPLGFSNNLASAASCRTVAGHIFLTFDMARRNQQLHLFYGAQSSSAARRGVLRAVGASYAVYDARDTEDGTYDPGRLPGLQRVYSAPGVTVLRVIARA